jgi:hypothetical protein
MTEEPPPDDAAASSELSDLCALLAGFVGPYHDLISTFLSKDGDKFERIETRLNELSVLLEEIAIADQFGDPAVLVDHIRTVFASINAIGHFVADVKQRLLLLESEVERRKPNKLLGFFKKKAEPGLDFSRVTYETDELLRRHNLAPRVPAPDSRVSTDPL